MNKVWEKRRVGPRLFAAIRKVSRDPDLCVPVRGTGVVVVSMTLIRKAEEYAELELSRE